MTLAGELKEIINGEVSSDEKVLAAYSTDASIFKVKPEAVVAPKDVEDVKRLVRWATSERKAGKDVSLTARAGGTDMSGGPLNESVILDFTKHFNRIKSVDPIRAVVEPGVYFRDLEKELDARAVLYPSYPASKEICAVGGMIANNSGGEKTLAYGKTERYVQSLRVVLADGEEYLLRPLSKDQLAQKFGLQTFEGELYRRLFKLLEEHYELIRASRPDVSKNSAGYALWNVWDKKTFDLTQLFVGSQGTLGFLTEATLRLLPKKKYSRLAIVFLKDLAPLHDLVRAVLPFKPESFESYDDHTLSVALKFLPDLIKKLKGNAFVLGLQFLPELWMVIRGGLPKLVLLIELTSDDAADLDRRLQELKSALLKLKLRVRLTRNSEEAEKYWTIRRESFNLLRHRVKNRRTVPFIDDVIVRPERLPEFLPRLNAILDPYGDKLIYTIAGHVGDGNFHVIPLMELNDPDAHRLIEEISEKVYPLVLEFKGSITAEHNDGLIRTPYLEMMYGEKMYGLFGEVKKIFDPLGIFNPRKKVGGDKNYAWSHLA